jgi:hypothetical protein
MWGKSLGVWVRDRVAGSFDSDAQEARASPLRMTARTLNYSGNCKNKSRSLRDDNCKGNGKGKGNRNCNCKDFGMTRGAYIRIWM